jgi:hypothetical protein
MPVNPDFPDSPYGAWGATVTRYVPTHLPADGLRTLVREAQGDKTFATPEEARHWMEIFEEAYRERPELGVNPDTFEVRPCECWAGHFGPCGIYFD